MTQLWKFVYCCLLIAVLLAAMSFAQGKSAIRVDETDSLGFVRAGVYRNTFLGFELTVPKDWKSLSNTDRETAKHVGIDALKTKNARNNKAIEEAANAEVVILAYAKKPLGALGNSVLALGAAKQPSANITPQMLVEAAKSLFLKNPQNRLIQDTKVETIGRKKFATIVFDLDLNGTVVRLKYFATMIRSYSLTASMSYEDLEDLSTAEASLRSIRFTAR